VQRVTMSSEVVEGLQYMQVNEELPIKEGILVTHVWSRDLTQGSVRQNTSFRTPYSITLQKLECKSCYFSRVRALSEYMLLRIMGNSMTSAIPLNRCGLGLVAFSCRLDAACHRSRISSCSPTFGQDNVHPALE